MIFQWVKAVWDLYLTVHPSMLERQCKCIHKHHKILIFTSYLRYSSTTERCPLPHLIPQCPRQSPMGACRSSPKNWGWALTRRRCLNSPTMAHASTHPRSKGNPTGANELTCVVPCYGPQTLPVRAEVCMYVCKYVSTWRVWEPNYVVPSPVLPFFRQTRPAWK